MTIERLERLAGADEEWQRPSPTPAQRRADVLVAAGFLVVTALGVELLRSTGAFSEGAGVTEQYAAVVSAVVLLVFRRSHPLWVASGAAAHLLLCSTLVPSVVATLPMQILYFVAIYSGVAWARERRAVPYVVLGQMAWRGAHNTGRVVEQARTIETQSERLRDQAVVAERLRIARELHDVVAHHVSVMGVQAAAARRVLRTKPEVAAQALSAVETSSRDAVGQMRDLLGTLRSGEEAADGTGENAADDTSGEDIGARSIDRGARDRSPQPSLADLADLVEQATPPSCLVDHTIVESSPGAAERVPGPVQLSAYRVVQEALANVRRHSTARSATAVVRVDESSGTLQVEVVDDGRPRTGTSGTGLGHLGMHERAQHLGGGVEVGPRVGSSDYGAPSGYRVRVWFPIDGVNRPAGGSARRQKMAG